MIVEFISSVALFVYPYSAQPLTTHDRESAIVAIHLGLTPQRLAASGVTGTEASSLLTSIEFNAQIRDTLIEAADALKGAERSEQLMRAEAEVSQDSAVQDQLATAVAATAAARAQHTAAEQAMLTALEGHAFVSTIRSACSPEIPSANLPGWAQLHIEGRGTSLARAFRAEERAQREGFDLDEPTANLLAGVRSDVDCTASRALEEANLEAVVAVFESSLTEE